MLNAHRARTTLTARAGIAALGLAALGLTATGGVAQTTPGEPKVVTRVVKITNGGETTVQQLDGKADPQALVEREVAARCANKSRDVVLDAETGDASRTNRTRIIMCGTGGVDRAARLESARARIAGNTELSAEHRARVLATLDEAIAKARAGQ